MSVRDLPTPDSPTDARHWAVLFTRARKRKGWGYTRLEAETGLSRRTLIRACTHGHCSGDTALTLITSLGILLSIPQSQTLTAHQAQFGR